MKLVIVEFLIIPEIVDLLGKMDEDLQPVLCQQLQGGFFLVAGICQNDQEIQYAFGQPFVRVGVIVAGSVKGSELGVLVSHQPGKIFFAAEDST